MLAGEGLCGNPRLADIGGVPNLIPLAKREKIYNFEKIAGQLDLSNAFMIGAGCGPAHVMKVNTEMMPNLSVDGGGDGKVNNQTYLGRLNPDEKSYDLFVSPTTDFNLMANVFCSEGKPGKVIEVKVQKRVGEENFMSCMRKVLAAHYGTKPVALGGVFLVEKGKVKIHIMRDFSKVPLNSDEEVNKWLTFHEASAPLVVIGELISHDPDLDLRVEHFHLFSDHGEGGHYHTDTTPDIIEYRAYLNVAEFMYRIDRPTETHNIGRD
ncbi:ester hydrolase C11orf54 homolog isoform X2 [Lingula anatina]|nr:ester hydrolase C11orf54 homolog isoform X2 [Lingula anatina]XP_013405406.1 ester hydrolase C11orf54 homolog isoform X2 [Lingula anatina]|eukprot:XP_013405405.1 ester hydrolase C11orf54 homolog isoform X2 [Lingula anatina]